MATTRFERLVSQSSTIGSAYGVSAHLLLLQRPRLIEYDAAGYGGITP